MSNELMPANNNGFSEAPMLQVTGGISEVAREQAEMQAAIVSAKKFPRNEAAGYAKLMKSMTRPTMAEDANYRFLRGGQQITGPSIRLAREAARCWENVRYGLRLVSIDADFVHIKGYALDLETNTYVEAEDKFERLIQRKNKKTGVPEWITPDERDLRELINKRGAIAVRNAILQIIPSDVTEDASNAAIKTLQAQANNSLKENRDETVKKLVLAFDDLSITPEMIEARLGHTISAITPEQLAELKTIYKSLRDGQAKREEFFKVGVFDDPGALEDLNKKLGGKNEQKV